MGCICHSWKSLQLSTKTFLQAPQLPGATLLHAWTVTWVWATAHWGAAGLCEEPKAGCCLAWSRRGNSCLVNMCLVSHGLCVTESALPGRLQVSWSLVSCWRWAFWWWVWVTGTGQSLPGANSRGKNWWNSWAQEGTGSALLEECPAAVYPLASSSSRARTALPSWGKI